MSKFNFPSILGFFADSFFFFQKKGTQFIWAVLKAWACMDIPKDIESKINTPANVIILSTGYWISFYTLAIYLEAVGVRVYLFV